MSFSFQVAHGAPWMSARRKNATVSDLLVMVTDADPGLTATVAPTRVLGSACRAVRSAYRVIVACGFPWVAAQSTTSGVVDRQYTLRSTTFPCRLSVSSTKYAGPVVGSAGDRTSLRTCWLVREMSSTRWSSSTLPARSRTL